MALLAATSVLECSCRVLSQRNITFDNVIQLNNVRSHVESFARAFILHRAYAARANDQKQLRASAPIADARRTRGPSRFQGCSADADYSRHAAEGPACVLSYKEDDPVQKFFVDTKKHAPYQYPKPKHSPYQKAHPEKVWDSDNGSWVDKE